MGRILMKVLRAMTTATLIGGSIFVRHVARADQAAGRQADVEQHANVSSELASDIFENSKSLFIMER